MPIDIEIVQDDIYLLKWSGEVTLSEVRQSHQQTLEMTEAAGVRRYVHIIDVAEMKTLPAKAYRMWRVLNDFPQVTAVYMVNAPEFVQYIVQVASVFVPEVELDVKPSVDVAVIAAKSLLAKRDVT